MNLARARYGIHDSRRKESWRRGYREHGQHNDTDGVATMCTHPILSQEEEKELARRIKEGDEAAYQELVRCNMKLVASIAKSHLKRTRYGFSDAVNNGAIGLMLAARRFDPEKGAKFSTYATWWIRKTIRDGLKDTASPAVCVPKGAIYLHYKQLDGIELSPKDKVTATLARNAMIGADPQVRGTPVEDDIVPYYDVAPYPDELLDLLRECLPKLSEKDRNLLLMRYGLPPYNAPIDLREVAKIEGVTLGAIRLRERKARLRLKALIADQREVFHSEPVS